MSDVEDTLIVPKTEHSGEGSLSPTDSSPEPEVDGIGPLAENVQVQKRKGGRKPIYATSEERKQRNRQAQAAFRERRTEYIKQLETTIKQQDDQLQTLQQSHRSAADECLMLRYKNSLLERILLEKGIDVQAELKSKEVPTASKVVGQQRPMQRAVINRHHQARRSISGSGSRFLHGQKSNTAIVPNQSPRLQPLSPSQTSSPMSARSPIFAVPGMPSPGFHNQQQPPLRGNTYPAIAIPHAPDGQMGDDGKGELQSRHGPWPSPYQTHIEQLEQEYESHADMIDDQDPSDQSTGPGPYPQTAYQHQPYPQGQPSMLIPAHQMMQSGAGMQSMGSEVTADMMTHSFDPFDPMLDADPFGLTASMHFPTQFTFQESAMRK